MSDASLKTRMCRGDILASTFLKTPAHDLVEVFATSGSDFICLDTEHAPYDRGRIDACLAGGRALDYRIVVRMSDEAAPELLKAPDSSAVANATKLHRIAAMTFTSNAAAAKAQIDCGMSTFFIGSDHAFTLTAAKHIAAEIHAIDI